MDLQFLGAAGGVTGSQTLVRAGAAQVLVDCGLFQGLKLLRERNRRPFAFQPDQLDAVLLTHAHLDHSGLLPALVKAGFAGPIYCTPATAALLELLLPDSGRIQEEDAAYANRKGFSRHRNAEPLYNEQDARRCLRSLRPVVLGSTLEINGLSARFGYAGHILGAAWLRLANGNCAALFSGDVGRSHDLLMKPPHAPEASDYVVVESTYGDRMHSQTPPLDGLAEVVQRCAERQGIVLIPSFAVGRAQALIYGLYQLKRAGRIPRDLPVFLNSPMAVNATALYQRFHGEHQLSSEEAREVFGSVSWVRKVEESKALNKLQGPAVIISASGMLTGGRVLHHLKALAGDPRNALVFPGFQAAGTRGAAILAGASEIKIHGAYVPIRCEVARLDGMSAHADADELVAWLRTMAAPPRQVLINHGEPSASDALRLRIRDQLGWQAMVPALDQRISLVAPRPRAGVAAPEALVEATAETPVVEPQLETAAVVEPQPEAGTAVEPQLPVEARRGGDLEREAATAAQLEIMAHPSYLRAEQDESFLSRDALRPARLMLEYLKPQLDLEAQGIEATIVVWGGTRIRPEAEARARLAQSQARLSEEPDNEKALVAVEVADRLLFKSRYYEEARRFAAIASKQPFTGERMAHIVTGGGPGVMEAANRGAHEAGCLSLGFNITLRNEQKPNAYITPGLCFQFRYFALRKMHFLLRACALVAFPGGLGTLDELFDCLCLMQTGKMARIPVVLVGRSFWHRAFNPQFLVDEGMIQAEDLSLFHYADSAYEAWEIIRTAYKNAAAASDA